LYLTGTPFRALANGEFLEDQIFTWSYIDEQRAKSEWSNKTANPYLELPQMVLMTYQLPDEVRNVALKGEFNEFDLNEFFKAEEIVEELSKMVDIEKETLGTKTYSDDELTPDLTSTISERVVNFNDFIKFKLK
jgi:hypothetical protein